MFELFVQSNSELSGFSLKKKLGFSIVIGSLVASTPLEIVCLYRTQL